MRSLIQIRVKARKAHTLISLISCLQTVVSEMATQWSMFLVFVMIFADNAAGAVVGFRGAASLLCKRRRENYSLSAWLGK